jgi:hypothetical protein
MCVIAVSPAGEKVAREVFERMWRANDDGFGLMYRARGGIGILKGILNMEEAWAWYERLPDGVPHVVHFRLATHGGVRPELTHPFIVSEDSPLVRFGLINEPVLAHNGIWAAHALRGSGLKLRGPKSDSRVLAAWLGRLARERPIEEVLWEKYYEIAAAGRVVVVEPGSWKIYLLGGWIEDGPFWFSNRSYMGGLMMGGESACGCDDLDDWPLVRPRVVAASGRYEDIALPESKPAEVVMVGPPSAFEHRDGDKLKELRKALFTLALARDCAALMDYIELEDYGDYIVVEGTAFTLEVSPPQSGEGMWVARLWRGDNVEVGRSVFPVENPAIRDFVERESAIVAFLEETAEQWAYEDADKIALAILDEELDENDEERHGR